MSKYVNDDSPERKRFLEWLNSHPYPTTVLAEAAYEGWQAALQSRAQGEAGRTIAGETDLAYCTRQMKAVANFLNPNWSNDMEWADEIIIAIQQREQALAAPSERSIPVSVVREMLVDALNSETYDPEEADRIIAEYERKSSDGWRSR